MSQWKAMIDTPSEVDIEVGSADPSSNLTAVLKQIAERWAHTRGIPADEVKVKVKEENFNPTLGVGAGICWHGDDMAAFVFRRVRVRNHAPALLAATA